MNCGLFQVAIFMYYEIQFWADEVAQQAKASAPKCDSLPPIQYVGPTWWMKRNYSQKLFCHLQMCAMARTHPSLTHYTK